VTVTVVPDDTGTKATAITWTKTPVAGSILTDPGIYCLRSNETTWDAEKLWRTYTMLTLSVQQRVTAPFRQRDGRTLHVRKATVAEPALRRLYDALAIDAAPGVSGSTPSDTARRGM